MFTAGASAAEIYVPEGGNQTIQQAVNNATAGDTITVRDAYTGTKENIDVTVAHLTIRSENGSASTIVNASNSGDHVFEVTADYVNISGFTVEDATGGSKAGIYLGTGVEHCNISDNNVTNNYFGIFLYTSSNNTLTSNTASNNNHGIHLEMSSNYNTLTSNTASSNTDYGIYLEESSNNNLTNNTASNNTLWDFYSDAYSPDNTVEDLTMSSYPTTISFTYDRGIKIKGVTTPESNPAGKENVSKYVNATNVTANSWIFLNVSYTDADVSDVEEGSLLLYKWNGTESAWVLANETGKPNGVNTIGNYVYANITSFSQIAPFGNPAPAAPAVPVPAFNVIGLLALVGILIVLAIATLRKRE